MIKLSRLFENVYQSACGIAILICILVLFLSACASSNVSRSVSSNVDQGVQDTTDRIDNTANSSFSDAYGNTSQKAKGVVMGGATGALAGGLISGVGILPGAATGAILGGSYGAYIDSNATLQDQLINRGVNAVVLGDQVLIVIPSARLFNEDSANINPTAYSTLTLVTKYINSFNKTMVRVSAYTDDTGAASVNKELSRQQANHVAKFLMESGVDARILYAYGYGGAHLVEDAASGWDSDNYRIEITLVKLNPEWEY